MIITSENITYFCNDIQYSLLENSRLSQTSWGFIAACWCCCNALQLKALQFYYGRSPSRPNETETNIDDFYGNVCYFGSL